MRRHRPLLALSGLAALAAVGALWFFFAPTELGGRVDYAVIYGTSMEPTLHRGDLAVLHERSAYSVGDVVGYHNGDLHRVVLHRIIGRNGDRFVFKGDNNGFVDSFEATQGRVAGRLWVRVPAVGRIFLWVRTTRNAIVVGVLAALLLAGSGLGAGAGVRRRRHSAHGGGGAREPRIASAAAWPVVTVGAAGALAFGLVALLGFVHSHTRLVSDGNAYLESTSLRYSGAAPAGPVYPAGRVQTGDTVFTKLVHRLTLTGDYRFTSALPHAVHGKATFSARLESQQGFSRMLPLAPPAHFSGDRWRAHGTLDLGQLRAAIDEYEHSTGVLGDSYTIDVVTRIALRGVVGGESVRTTFAPTPVSFSLDTMKLKLLLPEPADGSGSSASDPLHLTAAGAIMRAAPATIALGPLHLSVATARKAGAAGGLACALVCLIGLVLLTRGRGSDELARIRRRYGSWLIDVASPLNAAQVVDLTTIESLGRLAEYYDRAILHHEADGAHTFAIEREGTLYRYRLGGPVVRLEAAAAPDRPTLTLTRDRG